MRLIDSPALHVGSQPLRAGGLLAVDWLRPVDMKISFRIN